MNQPEDSAPVGEANRNTNSPPTKNVVDTAIAAGDFKSFAACIKAAGLTHALAAKGPFTLFAPTDEAFNRLASRAYEALLKDAGRLKAILNYHVVSGYFTSRDVKSGEVMTLQGSALTVAVSPSDLRVNGARVVRADIAATNGVVHTIDAVILPKNWQLLPAVA